MNSRKFLFIFRMKRSDDVCVLDERAQQKWRLRMLAMYGAFMMGSMILGGNGTPLLTTPYWGNTCLMRDFLGIPCPGCGITRSVWKVLHMKLSEALSYQPMGLAVAVALVVFTAYFLATLLCGRKFNIGWKMEVSFFSSVDYLFRILFLGYWVSIYVNSWR